MARSLELDPLQPARRLVHLEIGDQRKAADRQVAQHHIGIAVAEIERPRQHRRAGAEMGEQRAARLAPIGALPHIDDAGAAGRGAQQA